MKALQKIQNLGKRKFVRQQILNRFQHKGQFFFHVLKVGGGGGGCTEFNFFGKQNKTNSFVGRKI